jgi:hypothetical protein
LYIKNTVISNILASASEVVDVMCNEVTTMNPAVNMLIGLFSLCQNDQRLARVCPGNIVFVKASSNSVLEKYIVLSYSRDGKFEEYFDVAPEMSVDGSLSLLRVHKSSIIESKAYLLDDGNSSSFNSSVTLSKPALFCLNELSDLVSPLLMHIIGKNETNFKILYIKAIATSILTGFISQYKSSDVIEPTGQGDKFYGQVCGNWTMFVNILAGYCIKSMAPLSRRVPSKIEKSALSLLQILMNRPDGSQKTDKLPMPSLANPEVSLKNILTLLSDIEIGSTKSLPLIPLDLSTIVTPQFLKTMSSKVNSDVSMPNDSSDISAISKKTSKPYGANLQPRFLCNLGHTLTKITGVPQGKSADQTIFCQNCNIDDLESDASKYFRCSVCDTTLCSICATGINGEVICGSLE